ncbi:uncharacterized protein At5g65660-like [Impatiens glandulifera]|uniref:uncharacterized protein At5g65660-like n=1 Tax=Impatiens glandulifera TaxID=253017 RepID=UPI001FB1824E|nr:uncharacterized protein At5g65660-like [Impatiens glandulifera]
MDSPPVQSDAMRPTLGFPLGTGLLIFVIFSLSGLFSCCYHWDRVQSLRRSFFPNNHDLEAPSAADADDGSPSKPTNLPPLHKVKMERQSLPVIMPGDRMPTFIALPCPCEPPRPTGNIIVQPQKPIKSPPPPQIAVPLY